MKRMDYQEGCEKLREVGFTAQEIQKLCLLRKARVEQEMHQTLVAQREVKQAKQEKQVKCQCWFEKLMRKILMMCRYSAECEASVWMYDHFPY
jgi:DNA-binding transcriptional MerR regulator